MKFEDFYVIRSTGTLFRAFHKETHQPASPVFTDMDAAINYVMLELNLELKERFEEEVLDGQADSNSISLQR